MYLIIAISLVVVSINLFRWLRPDPLSDENPMTFRLREDLAFAAISMGIGLGALLVLQHFLFA